MISKKMLSEMNAAYQQLESRMIAVCGTLRNRMFDPECGWYNGHYSLSEGGSWVRESYPIPVVAVKGLCDIEISFSGVTLTTKLKRSQALEYSFDKLAGFDFEAYGVEDYLNSFYSKGNSISELKENIANSGEQEIFFSFTIPDDISDEEIYNFAKLLKREGFYY